MKIKNSYINTYNTLIKMDISEKNSRYLVDNFHSLLYSPINYLCGYPSILRSRINGALEKKLFGKKALKYIEEDLVINY